MNHGPMGRGSLHTPSGFVDPTGVGKHLHPLRIEPIEELESLRFDPVSIGAITVPANGEIVLPGVEGKPREMEAVIDPMDAREVGLNALRSERRGSDGHHPLHARMVWGKQNVRELAIGVSCASLDPAVYARSPEIGSLYLEAGEPVQLHVFVNRTGVEIFANGRQSLTLQAYPGREDSRGDSM
jgi:beta-fructofuranosidase